MSSEFDLQAFEHDLSQCQTREDVSAIASAGFKSLGYFGFDTFSVKQGTLESPHIPENFIINDYSSELIDRYFNDALLPMDLSLNVYASRSSPFDYIKCLKSGQKNASTLWQLGMARIYGVNHAWGIPQSTVGAIRGTTVYLKGKSSAVSDFFIESRDIVQLMSVRLFDRIDEIHMQQLPAEPSHLEAKAIVSDITAREADCLHWAARGKTNWEIGTILDISENTVRFHFKNIYRKFDCRSRAQAVQIAVQEKIVSV